MTVVVVGENQPRIFGGLSSSGLFPSLVPFGVELQSPSLSSHPSSITISSLIAFIIYLGSRADVARVETTVRLYALINMFLRFMLKYLMMIMNDLH